MMTIGEFALHAGISVKALRLYDERGVLPPAAVGPGTGYRFYTAGQLRIATSIRALRAAGMPLEAVSQVLEEADHAADLLTAHQDRLLAQRAREDQAVHIAERLLEESSGSPQVEKRRVGATHWAAISTIIQVDEGDTDDVDWANDRLRVLYDALSRAGNPPIGQWWSGIDPADTTGEVEVLLSVPVGQAPSANLSIEGVELRSGTLPDRTEAFVRTELSASQDYLLEGTPRGRLLHPGYLAFVEFLEQEGHDPRQMRQTSVFDDEGTPVGMELAATIAP